jgi:hypothetical protein
MKKCGFSLQKNSCTRYNNICPAFGLFKVAASAVLKEFRHCCNAYFPQRHPYAR